MKSKILFCTVLILSISLQFSLPAFASDQNQELFDRAWDNVLNSKHDTDICRVTIPFSRIDPKVMNSLSSIDEQGARLNLVAFGYYNKYFKTVFDEKSRTIGYVNKSLDVFPMAFLFDDKKLTFKQTVAAMGATETDDKENLFIGDKIYYLLDGVWNVFEDHNYADKAYKAAAAQVLNNFLDKSTLVFDRKVNLDGQEVSVYNGKASYSLTFSLLNSLIGKTFANNANPGSAQLFVGADGYWKRMVVDAKFTAFNMVATVREVCDFDFTKGKAKIPLNAKSIDKASGLKAIGG